MIGTRYEREQAALAEQRERYLAAGPKAVTAPVGPGRRPEERERLEAARQAAQAAREAARVAAAERAEKERRQALEQAERLKALKGRVDAELGAARAELRRAADAANYEAAVEAAARLVALELVSAEVLRAGHRFGASHRAPAWFAVGAQRV